MKTLKLDLKKKILLVEVPTIDMYEANKLLKGDKDLTLLVTSKNYKFLCKASELTEEIASELVESWESVAKDGTIVHENYKNGVPKYRTALDSFKSAVESKGYYWGECPIEKPYPVNIGCAKVVHKSKYGQWEESQSRTFNLENTLIFEEL